MRHNPYIELLIVALAVIIISFFIGIIIGYLRARGESTSESGISIFHRSVEYVRVPGLLIFSILLIANAYIQYTIGRVDRPSDWVILIQILFVSLILLFLIGVPIVIGSFAAISIQTNKSVLN